MITLRPFQYTDDDYRLATSIDAAIFDEPPEPIAEWKHDDQNRGEKYPYHRDIILRDGQPIGFVETYQSRYTYHPQKYHCNIYVHPQHDAGDVRPAVFQQIMERLADEDLIAIQSGMLDDKPHALQFFEEYGFRPIAEEKLSKLDVTAFNPDDYGAVLQRVRHAGIKIETLRRLIDSDPGWQRKLYDLDVTVNRDIPSTGEKHYPEFEEWIPWRLEAPTFDPDAWFIALDGDHYVAQSQGNINRDSQPVQFITGVTTVRRPYRRLGIATALKIHAIRFAKQQGVQEIFTTNDSQNPMYQLNLKLGFQPLPSWLRVEKEL
ncbi:MAG TPA: GNAT family N-acetyltransferase [Candidatus Sulfomarinibacteraceae bacterium]|nr:GNAT family N-acetyltransferase [Candidatus Sulfomarinibacteraceae bacterium]